MTTIVDEAIAQTRKACDSEPLDHDAIRGATMTLEREARTKAQKAAVERLKRASDRHAILMAADAVERAFLEGKSDEQGWPRRF